LDRFKLSVSNDGNTIMTGNYNSWFHLIDANNGNNFQYELSYKKQTINKQILSNKLTNLPKMDYHRKVSACDFNPARNMLAASCWNSFFIYSI
jgi:hypothetical protein